MSGPPPIMLLTPTWGGADGLSLLSSQYASALDDLTGSRLVVWTLRSHARSEQRATAYHVRGFDGRRVALAQATMGAALAARPPRLVITLHVNQLPVAAPLVLRGVPLVHVLVGIEAWRPVRGVRAQVLGRAARRLAISRHTFERFAEVNPALAPGGVTIVHPHTPSLAAPAASPAADPPGFALIVGRLAAEERYKGHDALIDAWPNIVRAVPGARLVCAGDGDDLVRLRQCVQAAGMGHAIRFTGAVSSADLAALYRDCAFLALPSLREGFGFVFLEAMAAGRACLGAPGSAEEIIVPEETGLIADPRQPGAVESALIRLFNDRSARTRMGQAGCVRAHTVFGSARFTRELGDALGPWLT